jgi:hypothetical protein
MARRLQVMGAIAVMAFLAMTEGAWACRCMNRLMNSCGCRSDYCVVWTGSSCCEPAACCDPCGQPAATVITPPANATFVPGAAPAAPPPAPPALVPRPAEAKPAVTRDLKPETVPEVKPEIKPEVKPPVPTPPAVVAPKEVETPAEPKAPVKPEIKPEAPAAKPAAPPAPAAPAITPPKIEEPVPAAPAGGATPANPPALKPPANPVEAKPAAPEKPKAPAKDDPFGTRNDVKTLRLWTDASGTHRIEARFVSFTDGTVRLQKADGRYVRIEYGLLSAADQDYVMRQDGSLYAVD